MALLALLALAALSARAAPPAAVARGEEIAQRQCSACHIVARNQQYPPMLRNPAPNFEDIANRPTTTEKSLRHFVTHAHWNLNSMPPTMPNQELSNSDTNAVVRYIMSLRKHRSS